MMMTHPVVVHRMRAAALDDKAVRNGKRSIKFRTNEDWPRVMKKRLRLTHDRRIVAEVRTIATD